MAFIELGILAGAGYLLTRKKADTSAPPAPKPSCKDLKNVDTANQITSGATAGSSAGPYGAAAGGLLGASSAFQLCGKEWEKKLKQLAAQGEKWAKDELARIDKARIDAQNAVLNAPKETAQAVENGVKKALNKIGF